MAFCIQNFIESKMNCTTPWNRNISNTSRICTSNEELKHYFDLSLDIYRGKYKKELEKCKVPDCVENHWNHKIISKISKNVFLYENGGKDVTNLQTYQFTASSKKVSF